MESNYVNLSRYSGQFFQYCLTGVGGVTKSPIIASLLIAGTLTLIVYKINSLAKNYNRVINIDDLVGRLEILRRREINVIKVSFFLTGIVGGFCAFAVFYLLHAVNEFKARRAHNATKEATPPPKELPQVADQPGVTGDRTSSAVAPVIDPTAENPIDTTPIPPPEPGELSLKNFLSLYPQRLWKFFSSSDPSYNPLVNPCNLTASDHIPEDLQKVKLINGKRNDFFYAYQAHLLKHRCPEEACEEKITYILSNDIEVVGGYERYLRVRVDQFGAAKAAIAQQKYYLNEEIGIVQKNLNRLGPDKAALATEVIGQITTLVEFFENYERMLDRWSENNNVYFIEREVNGRREFYIDATQWQREMAFLIPEQVPWDKMHPNLFFQYTIKQMHQIEERSGYNAMVVKEISEILDFVRGKEKNGVNKATDQAQIIREYLLTHNFIQGAKDVFGVATTVYREIAKLWRNQGVCVDRQETRLHHEMLKIGVPEGYKVEGQKVLFADNRDPSKNYIVLGKLRVANNHCTFDRFDGRQWLHYDSFDVVAGKAASPIDAAQAMAVQAPLDRDAAPDDFILAIPEDRYNQLISQPEVQEGLQGWKVIKQNRNNCFVAASFMALAVEDFWTKLLVQHPAA